MTKNYLIVDDNGVPAGFVDIDKVIEAGTKLAFDVAAACNDRESVIQTQETLLAEVGPDVYKYACATALQVLAVEILSPCLDVTTAAGHDLRPGILALAEGRDPAAAGR